MCQPLISYSMLQTCIKGSPNMILTIYYAFNCKNALALELALALASPVTGNFFATLIQAALPPFLFLQFFKAPTQQRTESSFNGQI